MHADLPGDGLRLDVDVVENFEVVGDEPDRSNDELAGAGGGEPPDLAEDIRAEPRLAGPACALEGDLVVHQAEPPGHEPCRPGDLLRVDIALRHHPRRQAVRREQHPDPSGIREAGERLARRKGERLDEPGLVEP